MTKKDAYIINKSNQYCSIPYRGSGTYEDYQEAITEAERLSYCNKVSLCVRIFREVLEKEFNDRIYQARYQIDRPMPKLQCRFKDRPEWDTTENWIHDDIEVAASCINKKMSRIMSTDLNPHISLKDFNQSAVVVGNTLIVNFLIPRSPVSK